MTHQASRGQRRAAPRSGRHRIARVPIAAGVALLLAAASLPASAQRSERHPPTSRNTAVRAELAAVLLHARRYDEAAREYRELLARHPRDAQYQLGLARALAWGDHPRAADAELRRYRAQHGDAPAVETLLRSVRDAYEPSAAEAATWVAERPGYAPYRLALARALAREGHASLAAAQYDALMRDAGEPPVPPARMLMREEADAWAAARAPARAAAVLGRALALAPGDTAVRHALAQLLVASGSSATALAQYDTLVAAAPTAPLYRERGELHLARHETALAESDLRASLAAGATPDTWIALGDLRRDEGDGSAAASAYSSAEMLPGLSPDDRGHIAAARAQLARDARPAVLVPVVGIDDGWQVGSDFAADNQGVRYATTRASRAVELDHGLTAGAGFEVRALDGGTPATGAAPGAPAGTVNTMSAGAGAHGTLAWQAERGPLLLRAMGRFGVVTQQGANGPMRDLGASALAALGPWQAALELANMPAYPSLFTIASLITPGEAPLTERDVTATLAGPAGPVDAGASWQRSWLSDGNLRQTGEAYARLPVAGPLAAVYQGTIITFAQRSDRYWDPLHYVAHALGPELAWSARRGLSAALRVLPEYARSRELVAPPAVADTAADGTVTLIAQPRSVLVTRSALQLGASAELSWRADGWEVAAALAHGRGRAGSYQRTAGTIVVRLVR